VPRAVLVKSGIKSVNAARQKFSKVAVTVNTTRPVNTAHPKTTMNDAKPRDMNQFCEIKGIMRQYSVARTLQQNKLVERRNRTLIEAARTMLAGLKLPTTFWTEAVSTACYVQNRVLVVKPHTNVELYETIWVSCYNP
nr:putative ribonuclease H-like domain-containing protein [Tanacetum cinerariifolium]